MKRVYLLVILFFLMLCLRPIISNAALSSEYQKEFLDLNRIDRGEMPILLAKKAVRKKKSAKKGKKKNRGGLVLLDNPYGENSSEWATIDLYSETDLKGEHWTIEVYGTKVTIKDNKGNIKKRFKDNYFKSARIILSSIGGVYFYDDYNYNRENISNYGWAYLPSNDPRIDVKDFSKMAGDSKSFVHAYYKIKQAKKGRSLKGKLSSIIIKFSKMR